MADQVSERIRVEASPSHCFDVATDFESYPSWARDVKEATVVERDAEGRGTRVEYRAAAMGRTIRYVLAYDYGDAPVAFAWNLVEGDMLYRPLPALQSLTNRATREKLFKASWTRAERGDASDTRDTILKLAAVTQSPDKPV